MSQERLKQAIENNKKDCTPGNVNFKFVPKQPKMVSTKDDLKEA